MSTSKHTPGPWSVDDFGAGQRVVVKGRAGFSGDYRIADAHFSSDLARCARVSEMQANARLIAAAPELLDGCNALLGLLQLVCDRDDVSPALREVLITNHRIEEARAALAKAGAS